MQKSVLGTFGFILRSFIRRMIPTPKCNVIVRLGLLALACLLLIFISLPAKAVEEEFQNDSGTGNSSPLVVVESSVSDCGILQLAFDFAKGESGNLPVGTHYLFYPVDNRSFVFASGSGLTLSSGTFTADECRVLTFVFSSGDSWATPTMTISQAQDFSYSPSNTIVFSDLGDYPRLSERREGDYQHAEVIVACVAFLVLGFNALRRSFYGG